MRKTLGMAGSLLVLVLAACSGNTSEGSQQASLAQGTQQVQGDHGPGRFLQHFDKNKDGKVQVSELPQKMQDRLAKADANGDGVLSEDEMKAHFDEMKKQMFADADKNKDGALDATEVGADRFTHIAPADTNKDGKVTQAELDAARAAGTIHGFGGHGSHGGPGGHEGRDFRGPRPSTDEVIAKFDTNKDGVLQASEIPEQMKHWISKVDTNADGNVTKAELDAAKAAHDAQRTQQAK